MATEARRLVPLAYSAYGSEGYMFSQRQMHFKTEIENVASMFGNGTLGRTPLRSITTSMLRKGDGRCDIGADHFHLNHEFENVGEMLSRSQNMAIRLVNALGEDAHLEEGPLVKGPLPVEYIHDDSSHYDKDRRLFLINLDHTFGIPVHGKAYTGSPPFNDYYARTAEMQAYITTITMFSHELIHDVQNIEGLLTRLSHRYYHFTGGHGEAKQKSSGIKEGIVVESLPQLVEGLIESKLIAALQKQNPRLTEGLQYSLNINHAVSTRIHDMNPDQEYELMQRTYELALQARKNIPKQKLREWAASILPKDFALQTPHMIYHGAGGAMAAIILYCRWDPGSAVRQLLRISSYEDLIIETMNSLPYALSAIRDPHNWESN